MGPVKEERESLERTDSSLYNVQLSLLEDTPPLELLIVSDQAQYRDLGRDHYQSATTPQGKSLFSVATATNQQLEDLLFVLADVGDTNLQKQGDYPNILLFDLIGDVDQGLSTLESYLSLHQETYAIAAINESYIDSLLVHPTWQSLQRNANGLALTQNYRITARRDRGGPRDEDYQHLFPRIHKELLTDDALVVVREIKDGTKEVTRSIPPQPTEFGEFSSNKRSYHPSGLIIASLDSIAASDPVYIRRELEQIQPANHPDSVPQHVYPPFEDMDDLAGTHVMEFLNSHEIKPVSLYVHIPFCPTECTYCDFSTIKGEGKDVQMSYLSALSKELTHYGMVDFSHLEGIHIGGGTPSMLPPKDIQLLGQILQEAAPGYNGKVHLSFEVNPAGITAEKLDAFKEIGATRASVGIQTTNPEQLKWWNRLYHSEKGEAAINMMLERWPGNTNIDLMYGIPGQTLEWWEQDLNAALGFGVPSITFYDLRVSSRTRFPDSQEFPSLYETMLQRVMAIQKFTSAGLEQKSDNQFVVSDKEQPYTYRDSKKRGGQTLGLGLSAYSIYPDPEGLGLISFNVGSKDPHDHDNVRNYIAAVEDGRHPAEMGRFLSQPYQRSLFTIQGLKLSGVNKYASGIDMAHFEERFGQPITSAFPHVLHLQNMGLVEQRNGHLGLTLMGLAFEQPVLKSFYQR